jgi:hypothetical protein
VRVAHSSGGGGGRNKSNSRKAPSSSSGVSGVDVEVLEDDGKLVAAEDRAVGAVKWATVAHFVRQAGGTCVSLTIVLAFFAAELTKTATGK